MKLYSALYNEHHPFDKLFPTWDFKVASLKTDLDEKDSALVIWGGGDIHPKLYNRENMGSYVGTKLSVRDVAEWSLMQQAIRKEIPIIGVCRGAQMGCAAAGGILIQDVKGHTADHMIKTDCGKTMVTSSLHHQMMFPWTVDHKLIAWDVRVGDGHISYARAGLQPSEFNIWQKVNPFLEPEIVWFPKIKCLSIQGHPEFMHANNVFNQYVKTLCEKYITI